MEKATEQSCCSQETEKEAEKELQPQSGLRPVG